MLRRKNTFFCTKKRNTMEINTQSNDCLRTIHYHQIFTHLCFQHIKSIKLSKLLFIKKLFQINLCGASKCFIAILEEIHRQHHIKMN